MINIKDINSINFDSIPVDTFWNTGNEIEMKMHRIHNYPAKFPAFITTKALAYAKKEGIRINRIADVFCGCGTVAYEAKRNNIDFWGCDINPVATMIAKAKSRKYQPWRLEQYYDSILSVFSSLVKKEHNYYRTANKRLKYWFTKRQYEELYILKEAINQAVPSTSSYRLFFLCAFSNILKPTSRWLMKSIKPQIDPGKKPTRVLVAFKDQCHLMMKANEESDVQDVALTEIVTKNFLESSISPPKVQMIVTSPPYVTSYEYADLHQLSSLWLDYADDYRDLREGSIGSLQHVYNFERELKRLNSTGANIVFRLLNHHKSIARSVAKYYLDMQAVAENCQRMLSKNGIILFVIGNTEYRGIRIDNGKHLAESLQQAGFAHVSVTKRKISKKILTPYRDSEGRFSSNGNGRKVYSEEFILIGRK